MAHPIKSVSNEQVLAMLRARGYQFPPDFNMSGAQNSIFRQRIVSHLSATGQRFDGVVDEAILGAKDLVQVEQSPDWSQEDKFFQTLKAYGIPEDQRRQIYEEAKKETGGIRSGGREVTDTGLQAAARRILGDTPITQDAERRIGLGPPPPTPGAAPAQQGPAPGQAVPSPPRATTTRTGGPKMAGGLGGPGVAAKPGQKVAGTGPGAVATPGTVTATGGGTDRPTDPFPTNPAGVRDWIARNNPEWLFLLDIPEVAGIIKDPNTWTEGADDADLRGRLMGTSWWQKTEPDAREWLALKAQDPAAANDQIAKRVTTLKQQAQALGITIPDNMWGAIAEDSLKFNWDDNEIRTTLSGHFTYDQNRLTGAASAANAHLKQAARDWLVPMDDQTLGQWVTQIVSGAATTDYFDTYLAQQAQSLFPQLADPISRGINPTQWMAPYKSIAAQTLEMNPEDIDLRDPKWMRAVSQVDDKGARTPMTLYDWTNLLKTDDTYGWDKTQQGRDHGASLARGIAAQFGFASGGGL